MPTWADWKNQLLKAAGILPTPPIYTFMDEWAGHDKNPCANAPITLSAFVSGATRCGATVTDFGYTYKYPSHAAAARAFDIQIHNTKAKALLDALNSGNPFQGVDRAPVVSVLKHWGSPSFATWYENATADGTTGGGSGGGGVAPHTHKAWHDLQRTINKRLPAATRHVSEANRATLRALSHGSKVHR